MTMDDPDRDMYGSGVSDLSFGPRQTDRQIGTGRCISDQKAENVNIKTP